MAFRNKTSCYIYTICVWFDYTSVLRCVFENVCVQIVFTSCVDRIAVSVLCQFGNIYTYRLHVWQMHYGVRVLHLQHRHVLRLVHMKCMPATLNAYSFQFAYLWPLKCVCSIEVVVSWGKHALVQHRHTDTRTHALSYTQRRCDGERVYAWLFPPSSPQGPLASRQPTILAAGLSLRRTERTDVSRIRGLVEHEWHLEIRLHVIYIIYVFDLIIHLYWGVF
jgi:hypothetical protein